MRASCHILKIDEEKHLVYGEVYAPDMPDTDGDFMDADGIEQMAHNFMRKMAQHNVDRDHDRQSTGSVVVESFIARKGDPEFLPGAWVVAVHIPDDQIWMDVKKGKFNGFSMDAMAKRETVEVEMEIPSEVWGKTQARDGHDHKFFIKFDDEGNYIGGRTDVIDGHYHRIRRSTITEEEQGHTHRFSYMEALAND